MPTDDSSPIDPEQLDIEDDDRVKKLDEDRYLVSADGSPVDTRVEESSDAFSSATEMEENQTDLTPTQVSRWLADSFDGGGFTYGFDATLSVEDDVVRHRMVSNDLPTTFETFLTWFVQNTTSNATTPEALGILLAASDVQVDYPRQTMESILKAYELTPEDSIADLLTKLDEEGGLTIPASTDPDFQE